MRMSNDKEVIDVDSQEIIAALESLKVSYERRIRQIKRREKLTTALYSRAAYRYLLGQRVAYLIMVVELEGLIGRIRRQDNV